jgi:hypothetical protein
MDREARTTIPTATGPTSKAVCQELFYLVRESPAVGYRYAVAQHWQRFILGRFSHFVECLRISAQASSAPHPQPHGAARPDGRRY